MISKVLFLAFVCVSLGKCDSSTETAGKDILQYLNSNSEQIYLYKSIKSLDIVNKEQDKYDVKTAIDVDCLQDADSPCLTKSFNCEGELQYMEKSGNFEIISLFCNPEIVENLKSEDEVIDTATPEKQEENEYLVAIPSEAYGAETFEAATSEIATPQPEPPQVPYDGGYCTGCFENVNVNATGVVDLVRTALKHLETERDNVQSVLEVISVQRQIVSGVHYVIIIKVAPTTCPKGSSEVSETKCVVEQNSPVEYCKIGYLQQAWISKNSNIISNNCTNSQEFTVKREDETTNVIDDTDKTEKLPSKSEDISPERLKEMEMQIIADRFDAFLNMAAVAMSAEENNEVPITLNLTRDTSSSEESDETSSSEENQNQVKQVKRSLKQSDSDSSETNETSETSEEEVVKRQKRKTSNNGCDDDSSSSSSSSDDDDDNNNNCNGNNGKSAKKPESNNGNGDDDSSSSSSSSSDDDDDNNNNNPYKKKGMYKRALDLSLSAEKALARNMAEFALTEMNESIEDGVTRIVLDVIITRKTRLEGYAYNLKIHTALADCKLPKIDYSTANLLKYHIGKEYSYCFTHTKDDTLKTYKVQVHVNEDFTSPRLIKTNNSREKRQLRGGITDKSVDDPTIVDLAHESVGLLDRNSGHDNKLKIVEITSASSQVVSGMLYRISVKISLSDCTKSDSKLSRDCNKLEGSKEQKCNIEIWDQPWRSVPKETTFNCENQQQKKFRYRRELSPFDEYKREKRQLVGGVSEADVNDPTIVELAHNSAVLLDGSSEHNNKYKVIKVTSASKQIVSGVLYRLQVTIALSDCAKTDTKLARDCNKLTGTKEENCQIKIWDRPWLTNGRETTFNCDNKQEQKFKSRRRRSIGRIYGQDDFEVQLSAFRDFKDKYNKVYSSKKEQIRRFKIFRKNLAKMHDFNQNERGTAVYGITKFSDLTYDEFRKYHMGLRSDLVYENEINFPKAEIPDIELPDEFDWRDKGVVTDVKDQGSCGSCWAFSTTGNVEGQYAIKHDKLLSFSEQELVDCDKFDEGCGGGLMDNAYRAIEEIGGLELEKDYPYDAENEKCHYNKSLFRVQVTGAVNISQNEEDMAKWLVANGPIAIAINANAMQFYVGGVSHPWKFLCSPNSLDHGVLIVGYGVHTYPMLKKTLPYWIVKNSWGKSWGEQGYYLVYRGDGTCGVNQTPSSAIVA